MEAVLTTLFTPYFGELKQGNSRIRDLKYFALLLLTLPIALSLLTPFFALAMALHVFGLNFYTKEKTSKYGKKTVLITGAPHTKGLQVCRFMKSVGHKVVLADMKSFRWNAARFSLAVDDWICLPELKHDPDGYEKAIMDIMVKRQIDWWIPVSHTLTAPVDCKIKAMLKKAQSKVKILSFDSVKMVNMLNDKIAFLEECNSVGLPVPEFHKISSVDHVIKLRSQGLFRNRHFFLKPLFPYSEDRVNFSRIPDDEIQFHQYLQAFKKKISTETPYFVSEYVRGPEYTGNCISSKGELTLFTCNPSSPMQIDYEIAKGKERKILEWSKEFCRLKNITGSICFDFMEDPATGRMLAIECNPRLHSCIVLMKNQMAEAGEAFGRALEMSSNNEVDNDNDSTPLSLPTTTGEEENPMVVPSSQQKRVIWLYNEIGKLAHVTGVKEIVDIVKGIVFGEDAVFDLHDPLPFFVLGHVQVPYQIWSFYLSGKEWYVINFCLGKIRPKSECFFVPAGISLDRN